MLNFLMCRTRADGVKHEIWINPDEVVAVDFFGADIAEIFLRCDKPTYVVSHKEARGVIAFVNRYACEPPIRDKQ